MGASSLREISLPRYAMRRAEAAASLGISPGHFDKWVHESKMPKGRKIGSVVLWDAESIRAAWLALSEPETEPAVDDSENPFDHMVV